MTELDRVIASTVDTVRAALAELEEPFTDNWEQLSMAQRGWWERLTAAAFAPIDEGSESLMEVRP